MVDPRIKKAAIELAEMVGNRSGNPDEGWGLWADFLEAHFGKALRQAYDAGLPDANDFPEVPNKWGSPL